MATTPNTKIPLIEHGEVNGDVTYKTGSQINDLHNQSIVEDLQSAEPASPQEGQAWIIYGTPTGTNWGADAAPNQVAHYYGGIFHYYTPLEGWRFYSRALGFLFYFDGLTWFPFAQPGLYIGGSTNNVTLNTSQQKIINYSSSKQWNWFDSNDVNPSAGEITVPATGIYRITAHILGQQSNTNKEEDMVLLLDNNSVKTFFATFHVGSDKGDRYRQLSGTASRQLVADEVLSLFIQCTGSLGNLTNISSTFEIEFLAID